MDGVGDAIVAGIATGIGAVCGDLVFVDAVEVPVVVYPISALVFAKHGAIIVGATGRAYGGDAWTGTLLDLKLGVGKGR